MGLPAPPYQHVRGEKPLHPLCQCAACWSMDSSPHIHNGLFLFSYWPWLVLGHADSDALNSLTPALPSCRVFFLTSHYPMKQAPIYCSWDLKPSSLTPKPALTNIPGRGQTSLSWVCVQILSHICFKPCRNLQNWAYYPFLYFLVLDQVNSAQPVFPSLKCNNFYLSKLL